MKDQRKRVAKRLASGLLAGALALGGLAISGGEVSATIPASPTTHRISGADRYETAVKIARDQVGAPAGLVIASGENPYDALAGAVLTSATVPMLLVKSDSIPTSVSDYISDIQAGFKGASRKVYVLGGKSAISDAVLTALRTQLTVPGDLLPPVVTRISGDNRYATAKAIGDIAGVTISNDRLIVVNGENDKWADALSASPISALNGWPIVLTQSSGLPAESKAQIDAYLAIAGSVKQVVIVGGTSAVPTSLTDYLILTKSVAPSKIIRIAGVDRYQTNFNVQLHLLSQAFYAESYGNKGGANVALVSGTSPWDALTSAGWSVAKNAHIVLSPAAAMGPFTGALAGTLASLAPSQLISVLGNARTNQNLYILGGNSAISPAVRAGYIAASSNNLTSTIDCPLKGAVDFYVNFSGELGDHPLNPAAADEEASLETLANFAPLIKVNGVPQTSRIGFAADLNLLAPSVPKNLVIYAELPKEITVGATVSFDGIVENSALTNGYVPARSIAGSSCTVLDDTTNSTIAVRAITGDQAFASDIAKTSNSGTNGQILISAGEPITSSVLKTGGQGIGNNYIEPGLVTVQGVSVGKATLSAVAGSDGFILQYARKATFSAGQNVTIAQKALVDFAGNQQPTTVSVTIAADSTSPTMSTSLISVSATKAARYVVGALSVTASGASSALNGAKGSGYTIKVTGSRGLTVPTVAIDDTAKTIVITADVNYHTVADITTAFVNAGYSQPATGKWTAGVSPAATATTNTLTENLVAVGCGLTCGTSKVWMSLNGNEPHFLNNGGFSITIGGAGSPVVSGVNLANGTKRSATTSVGLARTKRTVTFTTQQLGAGSVNFVGDNNGANDLRGNNSVLAATFTLS